MRKVMTTFASLVCAFIIPVLVSAQGQSIVPSLFLPGDTEITQAAGDQQKPAISQGGNQFLAVWSDGRTVLGDPGTGRDIYGIRLDAAGNLIDSLPFLITQGPADDLNPQVVWNGANWLVVWETWGENGTGYYYSKHIQAVRISPAGNILDSVPIRVYASGTSSDIGFTVGSDGTNWAIFLQGSSSGEADVMGIRISSAGIVLDVPPVLVLQASYYLRYNFHVAFASGTYLLAWTDLNDTQGLRLGADLNPISAPMTLAAGVQSPAKLAGNDTGFFLLYGEPQWDYTSAILGKRITASGSILDPAGINISQANRPDTYGAGYFVTWNGAYWVTCWGFNGMSIARVNTSGTVQEPGGVALPALISGPIAPTSGGGVQVVWEAINPSPYATDIATSAVSSNLTAGPVLSLSISAPGQTLPDLVYSGSGWMAVYLSTTSFQTRLLAQPLDANGVPVTAQPIQVASVSSSSGLSSPAIAWNGSVYLVAWHSQSAGGIQARRMLPDGTLLDSAPFFVMPGWSPDVAALSQNFLIVGVNQVYGPHFVHPFARRVRGSDGALLDSNPIMIGQYFSSAPAVTAVGNRWLAVWQRNFSHDDPNAELNGAFVDANGATPGYFIVSGLVDGEFYGPQIASKGDSALIVWEDERVSNVETEVVGRRILADGALQAEITITTKRGNQFRTNVAWDGTRYVVVYQDQRNRISDLSALDATSDIFGTRLDGLGNVIDSAGFVFASTRSAMAFPTVAAGDGKTLLAASVFRSESPIVAYRIGYDLKGTNQWPVANISADVTSGVAPQTVNFSSLGSYDIDGAIASYAWDFGDDATTTQPNPSHVFQTPGNYVVTLTLTDGAGAKTSNTVFVRIQAPNIPPVAVASASPVSGPTPLDVTFSASGSYDPDGAIGNIHWDFGNGWDYWGSPAYHTFDQPGTYSVILTVYDNSGGTGTDTVMINVGTTNQPPVAVATANPNSGTAPLNVSFSSAGSYDPDGSISSYAWSFGDGTISSVANPGHVYSTSGTYEAQLTVTDNDGAKSIKSLTINVSPASCAQCLHSSAINLSYRSAGKVAVSGNVTVKTENGVVMPGATVFITWTLPNGSTINKSALTNKKGIALFNAAGGKGTYTLRVTNIALTGYTFDPSKGVLEKSITVP